MMDGPEVQTDPVVKVARDLTEILRMVEGLDDQAENKSRARIDGTGLPGGLAMVDLAHVGSPNYWAERVAADELFHLSHCLKTSHAECHYAEQASDEDEDTEPPLQTLLFWSEAWREEHGYPMGRRPTIGSEAAFIRWALNWAWDNEVHWDDFAKDVNQARVRLENVLHAGRRQERTRVVCNATACETKPRLIKVRGPEEDRDYYKCPGCKRRYDERDFQAAHATMLRSEGAAKFVRATEAVATLVAQGRGKRTVRRWLAPQRQHVADRCTICRRKWEPQEYAACPGKRKGDVCGGFLRKVWRGDAEAVIEAYCDPTTHEVWVYWPDLWRRHLMTRKTPRASAA